MSTFLIKNKKKKMLPLNLLNVCVCEGVLGSIVNGLVTSEQHCTL